MKLAPRYIGPYKILRRINPVSYALALPSHFKIHNVFHVHLLKPLLCNRYTKVHAPPPPISVEGEEEFEVKAILGARISRGSLQYLVDWVGYGPEDRSWIPAAEVHAPRLVKAFYLAHPRAPGGRPVAARGGGGSVTAGQGLGRLAADSSLLAGQAPNDERYRVRSRGTPRGGAWRYDADPPGLKPSMTLGIGKRTLLCMTLGIGKQTLLCMTLGIGKQTLLCMTPGIGKQTILCITPGIGIYSALGSALNVGTEVSLCGTLSTHQISSAITKVLGRTYTLVCTPVWCFPLFIYYLVNCLSSFADHSRIGRVESDPHKG
uniref:Chromo domain-containing protein n=1 Tax=Leptobrachium leishanense TaxID=445787 RepID=A0A8C5M7I3_9ANUR